MSIAPVGADRVQLGIFPTPLHLAPRLSARLGRQVFLKRDDLTGLGLGGNKVRNLEYLLADATAQQADVVVTGGGPHSNHVALTAIGARRLGLDTVIVSYGTESVEHHGNRHLADLAGAQVRFTGSDDRASVDPGIAEIAVELRATGRRPYVIPRGGATALGAMGFFDAAFELKDQADALGIKPATIILATGSGGTQSGLVAGAAAVGMDVEVVGVTVSRPKEECLERIARLTAECLAVRGYSQDHDLPQIRIIDDYLALGYGKPSREGEAAIALALATEGIVLDPTFTAIAMAGLCDYASTLAEPIVFWHSGGAATSVLSIGAHE